MTANQIVRVIPVLKVNNRNVNQRFYEETLGMKVLVEEGALLSLGDASKVEKIVLEESPSMLIVCITDRDQVIAVSGGARKELLQKAISQSLERVINERQTIQAGKDDKSFVRLVDEELEGITAQVVAPIICEGDAIGAVAIMSREPRARFGEMELKLAATACGFLGRQMES